MQFLAGHPEISFFNLAAAGIYALARAVTIRGRLLPLAVPYTLGMGPVGAEYSAPDPALLHAAGLREDGVG